MRFLALCFCTLAILPATAGAQQSLRSATSGPTIESAAAGFRATASASDASLNAAPILRRNQGQDVAFMVVGGVALVTGLIIGDAAGTVLAVGGAALLLLGLYRYLE